MSTVLLFAIPDSIHTRKWAEGWEYLGYKTTISGISSQVKGRKHIIQADISPSGNNGKIYLQNILKFKNILTQVNPKILNPHYLTSYGFISALIKRKKDLLVLFLPGTDVMLTMNKNILYLLMARYTLNKADVIVSVSDVMTQKILKFFPHLKNKILTQQYGIDTKFLDTFQTKEKEFFLTTNRHWLENSNYPTLLEALEKFHTKPMKIIGAYENEYCDKLLERFSSLKKHSTGVVTFEENISFVAKSKIFISFTSSDGIPLSLLEAMYLGAIPIVSDIEPNKELIKDGINGFIAPINVDSLLQKIKEVNSLDEMQIKSIQDFNKKLILEKFDFEKNFSRLEKKVEPFFNKK